MINPIAHENQSYTLREIPIKSVRFTEGKKFTALEILYKDGVIEVAFDLPLVNTETDFNIFLHLYISIMENRVK